MLTTTCDRDDVVEARGAVVVGVDIPRDGASAQLAEPAITGVYDPGIDSLGVDTPDKRSPTVPVVAVLLAPIGI